ncbi:hypothetical protein [Sphingomonas hankyongi]|uniref:Secreted protein n=1 Tax=Sphingomonas hankyongi TaxID=2908209 RepID=A0ABT0RZM2_9SPHN|nr:hypothetical protein [Sphingomonas hankyongi]MCL6729055.1 hypothetical protein [Sphingomonas hankyongi]
MPIGLPVALALAAQAAAAAAAPPPQAPPVEAMHQAATVAPDEPPINVASADPCPTRPSADTREIVICAERQEGYRIDPDILTVKRMNRGGRPVRPGPESIPDTGACTVGPQGCMTAGINLVGAALTAAEMAKRVAEGKEIGSMFVTDPQPTEYQLYLAAKHAREQKELEARGKAVAKAARAKGP